MQAKQILFSCSSVGDGVDVVVMCLGEKGKRAKNEAIVELFCIPLNHIYINIHLAFIHLRRFDFMQISHNESQNNRQHQKRIIHFERTQTQNIDTISYCTLSRCTNFAHHKANNVSECAWELGTFVAFANQ